MIKSTIPLLLLTAVIVGVVTIPQSTDAISPPQQWKQRTQLEKVQCHGERILMVTTQNMSACMFETTVKKAMERGWVIVEAQSEYVLNTKPQDIVDDDSTSLDIIISSTKSRAINVLSDKIITIENNSHPDNISTDEIQCADGTVLMESNWTENPVCFAKVTAQKMLKDEGLKMLPSSNTSAVTLETDEKIFIQSTQQSPTGLYHGSPRWIVPEYTIEFPKTLKVGETLIINYSYWWPTQERDLDFDPKPYPFGVLIPNKFSIISPVFDSINYMALEYDDHVMMLHQIANLPYEPGKIYNGSVQFRLDGEMVLESDYFGIFDHEQSRFTIHKQEGGVKFVSHKDPDYDFDWYLDGRGYTVFPNRCGDYIPQERSELDSKAEASVDSGSTYIEKVHWKWFAEFLTVMQSNSRFVNATQWLLENNISLQFTKDFLEVYPEFKAQSADELVKWQTSSTRGSVASSKTWKLDTVPNALHRNETEIMMSMDSVLIKDVRVYDNSIALQWEAYGHSEYRVIIAPASDPINKFRDCINTTEYMFLNLEPDTDYVIWVGKAGVYFPSILNIKTLPIGEATFDSMIHLDAHLVSNSDQVMLSWQDNNPLRENRYLIERSIDGAGYEKTMLYPHSNQNIQDTIKPDWLGKKITYKVYERLGSQKLFSNTAAVVIPDALDALIEIGKVHPQTKDYVVIPAWIKSSAEFWVEGATSDAEFIGTIQYLIENGIITVPTTKIDGSGGEIPAWIKSSVGFWIEGAASDAGFIGVLQFLIGKGIIVT